MIFLTEPLLKIDFQQRCLATVPPAKVTDGFLSRQPLLEIGAICKNNFYTSDSHTRVRGRRRIQICAAQYGNLFGVVYCLYAEGKHAYMGLKPESPLPHERCTIQLLCRSKRCARRTHSGGNHTHPNDEATA